MGVLALSVPLTRTSNPSGLRPRRGKDFWFLARSENLRLAGSSPVGTFSPNHESVTTPPYAGAGAPAPGPRAYALGGITVFTSSRARKNRHPAVSSPEQQGSVGGSKDFWFLARSENLRLAGSSPVGTFSPNREPVTTPPYVSAGAPTPNPSGLRPRRGNGFLLPRALGKTVTPLYRVQSKKGNGEPFFARRCRRTQTGSHRRWVPASGPLIAGCGQSVSQLAAEPHPSKSRKYPKRWL